MRINQSDTYGKLSLTLNHHKDYLGDRFDVDINTFQVNIIDDIYC